MWWYKLTYLLIIIIIIIIIIISFNHKAWGYIIICFIVFNIWCDIFNRALYKQIKRTEDYRTLKTRPNCFIWLLGQAPLFNFSANQSNPSSLQWEDHHENTSKVLAWRMICLRAPMGAKIINITPRIIQIWNAQILTRAC